MSKYVITIRDDITRQRALNIVSQAPFGYDVVVSERQRTLKQNSMLWPLLSTIAEARPKRYKIGTPEQWKCRFLNALGYECLSDIGIDGEPYAMGLSSSALTVKQFKDLIELIHKFGAENGINLEREAPTEMKEAG